VLIASRLAQTPVKVVDLLPRGTAVSRFNTRVAILIIGLEPVPVIDLPAGEEAACQQGAQN